MPQISPSDSENVVLDCHGLFFRYGKPWVLEDVTFRVCRDESLCIIGPNGGGKSTLIRLIMGLEEPQRGELRVLGQAPMRARRHIGYVPQAMRFDPLFPITAFDIALMGRLDRLSVGPFSRACRTRAMEALAELRMADKAHRPFARLSGGERQRVMIARALACEPELLLLDEPTANIDLCIEEQFLEILVELRKKMTILLVTHDLDIVSHIGESALCVNRLVHRHGLPLSGETIREIYSGTKRLEHDRRTRHRQGDHTACEHD